MLLRRVVRFDLFTSLKAEAYTIETHDKGASINDVHENFGFFDPLPPCHIHDHATYQYSCPLFHYPCPPLERGRHWWKPLKMTIVRPNRNSYSYLWMSFSRYPFKHLNATKYGLLVENLVWCLIDTVLSSWRPRSTFRAANSADD